MKSITDDSVTRARAIGDNLKIKNQRGGKKKVHFVCFAWWMINVRNSSFLITAIPRTMVLKVTCHSKSPKTVGGLLELNKDKQY